MTTRMANIRGLLQFDESQRRNPERARRFNGRGCGDGFPAADRPDAAADRVCRDRLPRRAGSLGGDQVAAGPRCAGDRRRGGIRGGDRRAVARPERSGIDSPRLGRGHGILPHQPADRRQPVLGSRPDGRVSRLGSTSTMARRSSTAADRGPGRSTTRIARCAGRSAGTAPSLCSRGRGS